MVVVKFGVVKLPLPSTAIELFESYHLAVPVAQVADNEAVSPLQMVRPDAVGAVGLAFTVTVCEVRLLTQFGVPSPPLSQATKYVVFVVKFGVVKLPLLSTVVELFESYHLAVPVAQVADNEAVSPLQMVFPDYALRWLL